LGLNRFLFREKYVSFLLERMAKDIEQLINSTLTSREEHVGLEVSCLDLLDFDPSLAHSTLLFPLLALQIFEEVKL
jgi:hypothetical protein